MTQQQWNLNDAQSVGQALYEALKSAIFDGSLKPGERLVEETIAASASVSRTPVREALRRLEVEGLVQSNGRRKTVSAPTRHELSDLLAVREVLEAMAGRLAANSRTELDLQHLQQVQSELRQAVDGQQSERYKQLNDRFHEGIWHAARNQYLEQQLALMRGSTQRLQNKVTMSVSQERLAGAMQEHELILQAIEVRDAERAAEHVHNHFRQASIIRLSTY